MFEFITMHTINVKIKIILKETFNFNYNKKNRLHRSATKVNCPISYN